MNYLKSVALFFIPYSREFRRFSSTRQQGSYFGFLKFKVGAADTYWPKSKRCLLANKNRIYVGINSLIGRPGAYIQGAGEVYFGNYVQLAPNVGILSSNHDLYDQRKSNDAKVVIGDYSWIGMNSVILPGVTLGTRTIVAAGSVVTKSFHQGYCVVAGSPAKVIKELDKEKFIPWVDDEEFYGYVPRAVFEDRYSEVVDKLRSEMEAIGKC